MGWFGSPILHRKPWGCTTYTFHEAMDGNILNTNIKAHDLYKSCAFFKIQKF